MTENQHKFVQMFVIGVGTGIMTNIIMSAFLTKKPPHPLVPVTQQTEVPPPGA